MSHKDLIVVEKAINFSVEIYKLTSSFPKSEIFGLIAQMRRASVSIASNIAEGSYRTPKEFIAFLRISKGSAAELIVQLKIALKLQYIEPNSCDTYVNQAEEIIKMLHSLTKKLATNY